MASKNQLKKVAVKIGGALGRADRKAHQMVRAADRKAHQMVRAGALAKEELAELSKQVDVLKRQLAKTTKRLKHALS
jgi:hypothetical protein